MALNAIATHVFLPKASVTQKQAMHCFMHKTSAIKVRMHVTRFGEIDYSLSKFPPFGVGVTIFSAVGSRINIGGCIGCGQA